MRPYSLDLRNRALAMSDLGKSNVEVAKTLSISERTIYLWKLHREERSTIIPITKYQKGHSHKLKDLERFKEFVNANPSLPTKEMAKQLAVSPATILRKMKLIGYSHKKKPLVMWREMRKLVKNLKTKFQK